MKKEKSILNDSGERITYSENSAMREPTYGKGRYDLISAPAMDRVLTELSDCNFYNTCESFSPAIIMDSIYLFISNRPDRNRFLLYAIGGIFAQFPEEWEADIEAIPPSCLHRLAQHYENGAKKYEERNYEKGMPFSRYCDSALRHLNQYIAGKEDEDHLIACLWNLFALLHHISLNETEKWDDLPNYERS